MIVAIPPDKPFTTPLAEPTVATEILLLAQVPLPDGSLRPIDKPEQTGVVFPAIAAGNAETEMVEVVAQPLLIVYVIVVVPGATPVTTPELRIVATPVLPDVQDKPPVVASVKVAVAPVQSIVAPVIASGKGLTVIVVVAIQAAPNVYVTVTEPAAAPVKIPLTESIVPAAVLLLLHVPPVLALVSVVEEPAQIWMAPPTIAGSVQVVVQPAVRLTVAAAVCNAPLVVRARPLSVIPVFKAIAPLLQITVPLKTE